MQGIEDITHQQDIDVFYRSVFLTHPLGCTPGELFQPVDKEMKCSRGDRSSTGTIREVNIADNYQQGKPPIVTVLTMGYYSPNVNQPEILARNPCLNSKN
jgi:hypothetical protein